MRIAFLLASSAACAIPAAAQDGRDSLTVEVLAARHLLERHQYPRRPLRVDSGFAPAGHAPGSPTATVRPGQRHRALTDSLDRDRPGIAPSDAPRRAVSDTARLTLSEPAFAGDKATVTVTIGYDTGRRPRGGFYETLEIVLRRVGTSWQVLRSSQLGIT